MSISGYTFLSIVQAKDVETGEVKAEMDYSDSKKELILAQKRMDELDKLSQNLYESNMKGTISDRQCKRLMQEYDKEQTELEKRIHSLRAMVEQKIFAQNSADKFAKLVDKYTDVQEVTDKRELVYG